MRSNRSILRLLIVVFTSMGLSLLALSCWNPNPKEVGEAGSAPKASLPPSIALVTVDSLGAGTPLQSLARLAEQGVRFSDAVSTAPLTRPALASIFFADGPDRLGVRDNLIDPLPTGRESIVESLRSAGYRTAGFSGTPFAAHGAGFSRGFEIFDGPDFKFYGVQQVAEPGLPSADLVARAATWLQAPSEQDRPRFVWVHLSDLLNVVTNGNPAEANTAREDALAHLETGLTELFAKLDASLGTNAEVIVVGTHGALFVNGGRRGDSYWLEEGTLHVPLLWRGPRARAAFGTGMQIAAPVWISDVGATVLELAGLPVPRADGRSLLRAPVEGEDRERLAWTWATDDHFAWAPRTAKHDGSGWIPIPPGGHPRAATPRSRSLSEEAARAMTQAGVQIGTSRGAVSPLAKDEAESIQLAWDVRHAFFRPPKPLLALKHSLKFLQAEPQNFGAMLLRLFVLYASGNPKSAEEMTRKLLDRYPDRHEALHWSAHVAQEAERNQVAEALLKAAASVGPQEAEIYYDLACARAVAGDRDAAFDWLEKAIDGGYRQWSHLENDVDLASLRADHRYAELMRKHGR